LPSASRGVRFLVATETLRRDDVLGRQGEAKFWLHPEVRVAASVGFDRRALSELVTVVEQRREEIERAWHEHFG
jgi:hypothetical protein